MTLDSTSPILNSRYRVLDRLGAGGMGTVYRVYDRLTGKIAALKRVNLRSNKGDTSEYVTLAREFRLLASFRHPNIINVTDYGFDESRQPFYVMALIEDARTITQAGRDCDLHGKVKLIIDMLQALVYLHRRGVLHRDLKPDNALVDPDDQLRLVDFGLSLEGSQADDMSGTLAYMPPEVLRGEALSPASDLYSVGVIAYELLTGDIPFEIKNVRAFFQQVLFTPPDLSPLEPSLAWVIGRLLAKDPADRYASAGETIRALCEALNIPLPEETRGIRESLLSAAKFVGRQTELDTLMGALDSGRGSAWLIGGEAGVGKSRVVEEIRIQALVKGFTVVRGQAVEGGGLPYQLLRNVLPTLILGSTMTPLEASVLLPLVPEIGQLLEREVTPAPELDPQLTATRLKNTLLDVFRRQPQPILLLLEDLHWADDSLDLLDAIIGLKTKFPVVIIATYRSDEAPHLHERLDEMRLLSLARLTAGEVETLAVSMLEDTGRDPNLINYLLKQTEGNAFFIVDLLQSLGEDAGRLDDIGSLKLRDSQVSQGVLAVAQRRLARVPESMHRAVRLAAVIGREIDFKLIAHGNQDWVDLSLENAILESDEGRLCFAHDRIREGILRQTKPDLLRQLHGQAAQAIESVYAGDERYYPVLAGHWKAAGDDQREGHYALEAGKQAVRLNQFTGAQTYFERVLSLLPDDDPRSLDAVEQLGKLYHMVGKFWSAQALYEKLLTLPNLLPKQRVDALITLADSIRRCGDIAAAEVLALQAYSLAEAHGYLEGEAKALTARAYMKLNQEAFDEALVLLEETVKLYQALGDTYNEHELARMQLHVYFTQGDILKILQQSELCLDISTRNNNLNRIALDCNNLGVVNTLIQNYEPARAYLERAKTLASDIGNTWTVALAWSNLTYNYIQAGDLVNAVAHFARTVQIAHDYRFLHLINGSMFLAAMIKRLLGDPVTAVTWMQVTLAQSALEPDVRRVVRLMIEAVRDEMSPDEYANALVLGESLTVEDVYAMIRAELLPPS